MAIDEKEEYRKWEEKRKSLWTKVSQQIKAIHVIVLGFLIFLIATSYSSGKISKNVVIMVAVPVGILILFLMFRESREPQLIPEHIIKQIVYDALERKRREGKEIPFDWKVRAMLVGTPIYETDYITGTSGMIMREVGFEIIKKGYRKSGIISIHPYNGTIGAIRWAPMGYTGNESVERRVIVGVPYETKKEK